MKIISEVLTILVFACVGKSESITVVGDIRIEAINGILYCDSMQCPISSSCQVTKRNDPNDFSQIIRKRKCFDTNGAIIAQETRYEPNRYQNEVNLNIISGGGGTNIVQRPLTPEEQKALDETLRHTEENLRPFRDGTFERNLRNQIYQNSGLRQFQDGTFERNLRNTIDNSLRNSLKF